MTLNFDRLVEQALRTEGIEPTVIASPADVAGMAPLHMLECCVVHLHGDYLNPASMLNTTAELSVYDPGTLKLLHRILEDYGLIIAGWSLRSIGGSAGWGGKCRGRDLL
ncbi:SIR2 family protein [Actinomadura rudentiformis]|uniref:SIR2 family protein n=1 Tax=Actinomadura rudentiformis TaxID=359158 RepID=UPI00178C7891|nr:SIR2 family protein [Actinomadura rudentiformis]